VLTPVAAPRPALEGHSGAEWHPAVAAWDLSDVEVEPHGHLPLGRQSPCHVVLPSGQHLGSQFRLIHYSKAEVLLERTVPRHLIEGRQG
jgi:hypothetical protein